MKFTLLCLILALTFPQISNAHKMDQLGPNGGIITMPGAYHVELVQKENNLFVYLLDINFKNPLIENSKVSIIISEGKNLEIECKKASTYFDCPITSQELIKYKNLELSTTRNNMKGALAKYHLPLKLSKM